MNRFLKLDWILLVAVFLLLILGLVALYSVSYQDLSFNSLNFKKQVVSVLAGLIALLFFSYYDYRVFNYHSTKLYFGIIAVLILVILFGTTIRGTTGWVGVGAFHIQPVEITKLILIIFLASFLSKKKNQLSIVVRIIASMVLISIPVFFILQQPDFGSSLIIVACWAVMLTLSGISKKNLFILFMVGMAVVFSSWFFLRDYQKERVLNFLTPGRDPRGSGYNVIQSMVAVGSGGLLGRGLGHGSQSQLNFLPEKHTDFIFAVIAEELGLAGSVVVFFLFGIIFWRMKEIARLSRDNFGYMLTVGVIIMMFSQFLINVGMNIGVMPVAGVPLPFLSYGGSSLVAILSAVGVVESVYLRREKMNNLS